ncbi:PorP/SprF family type IX secretion system membrane protein [Anaerophaga thermohalophila]|uniref:PorP/SprF family type IX secretion system membrane protein n=1 Tax=Anaerophaga thermohalophila TaxID=177400 RepID=UPI0003772B61|nr:type IX secretion system membrane protein PorP/SprF [Anaerophaga thermohalophila]
MKERLYITGILILMLVFGASLKAQDQYQFNHYIANQGLLNPAYNGTRDIISGLLIHRSQWLGMEGAPMNQALNVHSPIEETNLGVGLVLVNDHIGFSNTFDAFAAASYKLQIDRNDRFLSFGLQAGVSSLVWDGTKAEVNDPGDPVFDSKESKMIFNVGFGAYFYSDTYFAGFSVPKIFSNQFDEDPNVNDFKNTLDLKNMHSYLYGGYVFELEDVIIKPTMLVKYVYGAPLQLDITGNVMFMDRLWLGLSYRTISDVVFLGEYIINDQFTVRYSFDYPISELNQFNNYGTHEISLQFDFSFNSRPGMRSIRYF